MSIFTKTLAIAVTVLALGASAQAQSNNGGGRGGGGSAGGEGEPAVMAALPNGPVTHVERRRDRMVRVIPIQPCADGNAAMNRHVCNPMPN